MVWYQTISVNLYKSRYIRNKFLKKIEVIRIGVKKLFVSICPVIDVVKLILYEKGHCILGFGVHRFLHFRPDRIKKTCQVFTFPSSSCIRNLAILRLASTLHLSGLLNSFPSDEIIRLHLSGLLDSFPSDELNLVNLTGVVSNYLAKSSPLAFLLSDFL